MSDTALKMADDLDILCDPYDSAIAAELRRLVAENAALRADAERYRWLRLPTSSVPISAEAARDPVLYDAAIDAARSKE